MSLETKLYSSVDIDFDEVISLHREAFSGTLDPQDSMRIHQSDFFRWKWSSPEKPGMIAVVKDKSKFVSMNAMTWNRLCVKSSSTIQSTGTWLSCDTATHPEYRGRGLFMNCLKTLAKEINSDEVFAGFPNASSLPGFEKFGWQTLAVMKTFIRPILPSFKNKETLDSLGLIPASTHLQKLTSHFAEEIQFSREPAWLKWRYQESPNNPYLVFNIENGSFPITLVVRKYQKQGLAFLVLMDWSTPGTTIEPAKRKTLVEKINPALIAIGRNLDCRILFVQSSTRPFFLGALNGWIPVPNFVLPKRPVFAGHLPPNLLPTRFKFDLKLGDWDGL